MKRYSGWKRYEDYILALLATAVNIVLMGICFDFYYDLNDDVMMADIMSGAYSGIPDGHNMQTLYPLGALLALCYRVCREVPWYGLFLCLCQFGCFCLAGARLCALAGRAGRPDADERGRGFGTVKKVSVLLALSLFAWGLCLGHLVNIQYTVTSAILSATAVFLFLTTPGQDPPKAFIVKNIPAAVLVTIAYQLRSEMLLLTFPFICLAGLYRLCEEKKIFVKQNLPKYGGVLGIILAGMLVSRGIDYAAYGSEGWKDFLRFFQARTTVYDFYPELVTGDEYREALEGLGVSSHQQALLRNYNYGLDETIDTGLLSEMADYATGVLGAARNWGEIARKQVYRYFYRTFRGGDFPYSTVLLWMYAAVLVAGFALRPARKFDFVWQVMLLAAVRTAVWMFILLRGRDPARITHSLYLVECSLLAAMGIRILARHGEAGAAGRASRCIAGVMAAMFVLAAAGGVADGVPALRADQKQRGRVNRNWYAIDAYCKGHDGNFYFEDVYSTVAFSRRIFDGGGYEYANYDIMGGWMCGSPLYYDKIGHYGITSVQDALLTQDNVYLLMSDAEAVEQGFGWIVDYYGAQGIRVMVDKKDTVGDGYAVYQVVGAK